METNKNIIEKQKKILLELKVLKFLFDFDTVAGLDLVETSRAQRHKPQPRPSLEWNHPSLCPSGTVKDMI